MFAFYEEWFLLIYFKTGSCYFIESCSILFMCLIDFTIKI